MKKGTEVRTRAVRREEQEVYDRPGSVDPSETDRPRDQRPKKKKRKNGGRMREAKANKEDGRTWIQIRVCVCVRSKERQSLPFFPLAWNGPLRLPWLASSPPPEPWQHFLGSQIEKEAGRKRERRKAVWVISRRVNER